MSHEARREYFVLGLNHKTAAIEVRERMTPFKEGLPALAALQEYFILSTCNRFEIHGAAVSPQGALFQLRHFFREFAPHLYSHTGEEAIRHLFRVTASLDSMIVGEAQITGQVKAALALARERGWAGLFLQRVVAKALSVAKRVRSTTLISGGSVSFGSVAVDITSHLFDHLSGKKIAMIGAGKVGSLVIEALGRKGVGDLTVLNRTVDKAKGWADRCRLLELNSENLKSALLTSDVAIASVEGKSIISRVMIDRIMKQRRRKPLLLIDLGVPRNIEPLAAKCANVYLYDIDDMQSIIQKNLAHRQHEARLAEEMAATQAKLFFPRLGLPHPFQPQSVFRLPQAAGA
ncbi:MAG: glutamyl-tRNA reductase [Deltaproteobacteria bacterium]|nr:glutamyl-tRNA reductase [Deltaproteobacteria bacterium]